jgi:hypothetical protein
MIRNTLLCGAMILAALPGFAATAKADDQAIIQRLDKLEKENAALRERLNHIEHKGTAAPETAIAARDPLSLRPLPAARPMWH